MEPSRVEVTHEEGMAEANLMAEWRDATRPPEPARVGGLPPGAPGGRDLPERSIHAEDRAWPPGKRLALMVNVALEGWSTDVSPGVGPMGNPLPGGAIDFQARSWAEYGPRRGMPRLMSVLGRAGVKATVMTSGIVGERYPELLAAVAAAGHDVCAHGYAQELVPATLAEAAERQSIADSVRILEAVTGVRPTGWISPRCTPSDRTARLLAESGFQWHADAFDDDLPRVEVTSAGPIVAIPFTMEVNDLPLSVRYGRPPEQFVGTLRNLVDGWFSEHGERGCLDVTVHAHVFGRPLGAQALEAALGLVCGQDWVWMPTHAELAALYLPMKRPSAPSVGHAGAGGEGGTVKTKDPRTGVDRRTTATPAAAADLTGAGS